MGIGRGTIKKKKEAENCPTFRQSCIKGKLWSSTKMQMLSHSFASLQKPSSPLQWQNRTLNFSSSSSSSCSVFTMETHRHLVQRTMSPGWAKKTTKFTLFRAAVILRGGAIFPKENGFSINLIRCTIHLVRILVPPSLVKEMAGRILTTRSGNGSRAVAPFPGSSL